MKLIFLDRDGVINKDTAGYVSRPEDFVFVEGSLEAIKKLHDSGYKIIVISNQAGISKGIYTEKDLTRVTDKMVAEVERAGAGFAAIEYCLHQDNDHCLCRKPGVGMFEKACKGMNVDYKECYFIGDKQADVEAGRRIGTKTILVLSGKASKSAVAGWPIKPDYIKNNLKEAVDWLAEKDKL